MTSREHTTSILWAPALAGAACVAGAIGLLISDGLSSGHLTVSHALQPLLVVGAVVAACMAHRSLASWRPVSALLFIALALLGSLAVAYGTLGRTAEMRDGKVANALASNRQLTLMSEELTTARATAARECKSGAGQKCATASARVDALVSSLASQRTASPDPRADALAKIAALLGFDGERTRAIAEALDPLMVPLFLELGSIVFFAAAFPHRKAAIVIEPTTIAEHCTPQRSQPFTREQALHDVRTLRQAGSGRYLAQRWGVDPSTASRWLQSFEALGAIDRNRAGKSKAVLALPSPRR